ncbi:MAG: NHL repeat-containing protein [Bacteroidetes bacterium]|nr:NHL repeat-containing protein [Bacteroidota bacterium]
MEGFGSIGDFSRSTSISINSLGYIYITDTDNNTVYQYNTDGELINSIGGFGWDNFTFDMPVDVFASDLKVYVADKNNHRIQIFDRNLNYITGLSQDNQDLEINFAYPTSIVVTRTEDILLLDSESSRVIRYNSVGEVLSIIGDYDAGDYALENPSHLSLLDDDRLMVVDGNRLIVFDIFGNPISTRDISFAPESIYYYNTYILLTNGSWIYYLSSLDKTDPIMLETITTLLENESIVDLEVHENMLYILTTNRIIKHNFVIL